MSGIEEYDSLNIDEVFQRKGLVVKFINRH